jgi:hypothetical protein
MQPRPSSTPAWAGNVIGNNGISDEVKSVRKRGRPLMPHQGRPTALRRVVWLVPRASGKTRVWRRCVEPFRKTNAQTGVDMSDSTEVLPLQGHLNGSPLRTRRFFRCTPYRHFAEFFKRMVACGGEVDTLRGGQS